MTANSFSVDDAFQSEDDDNIRLYGTTNKASAMKVAKLREDININDIQLNELDVQIQPQDSSSRGLLLSQDAKHSKSFPFRSSDTSYSISSLWTQETHVSFPPNSSWLRHPKVRENWKTVAGAFALTVVGLVLNLAGVGILATPQRGLHCLVFFIGGMLCLIPGAYHLVYIYCAVTGHSGYNLYDLPVFH